MMPVPMDPDPDIFLGLLIGDPEALPIPGYETVARYAEVQLVPDDIVIRARVGVLGQGLGRGLFVPLQQGDQVLVHMPNSDEQAAVITMSFGSLQAPHPSSADGEKIVALHPGGVELRNADAATVSGVVLEQLAPDLGDFLSALAVFMQTSSTATTAPQIAAAAATFLAAVAIPPAGPVPPGSFPSDLNLGPQGPYVSDNIKAT